MKEVLKELNVEKLNICEPDGTVKMSLFNSKNIPSLIMDHEDILPGHREQDGISGLMFYNNEGDECGGLIYGSNVDEEGNEEMGISLTFDKFKQDQVLQLHLNKRNDQEQYGISIYDRPDMHIKDSLEILKEYNKETDQDKKNDALQRLQKNNHKRIFIGNDIDGQTKVSLYNKEGLEKIKFYIDESGEAQILINGTKLDIDSF